MEVCTRGRTLRNRRLHRASRWSRHSRKSVLASCTGRLVCQLWWWGCTSAGFASNLADLLPLSPAVSARRPRGDADAASGLLLPSAHAAAALPLPAHRARPAAAVHGRLPIKPNLSEKIQHKPPNHFTWLHGLELHMNFALYQIYECRDLSLLIVTVALIRFVPLDLDVRGWLYGGAGIVSLDFVCF